MEIFNTIVLGLSGLLLTMVGIMRLTNPKAAFSKNSGIELPDDPSLLNEIKGISALMMLGGLLVALGTVSVQFKATSFAIGSLIFLGFLVGRLFSTATEGKPNPKIIQGMYSEVVLGGLNLYCLLDIIL